MIEVEHTLFDATINTHSSQRQADNVNEILQAKIKLTRYFKKKYFFQTSLTPFLQMSNSNSIPN